MTTTFWISLLIITMGPLPCYLLANHILRHKNYSMLAGFAADRIKNQDAYAQAICRGIKGFALVMAAVTLLHGLNCLGPVLFTAGILLLPLLPLFYGFRQAKGYLEP